LVLFLPQRGQGIQAHRAVRAKEASCQGNGREPNGDRNNVTSSVAVTPNRSWASSLVNAKAHTTPKLLFPLDASL
jgi:hypothetical protein